MCIQTYIHTDTQNTKAYKQGHVFTSMSSPSFWVCNVTFISSSSCFWICSWNLTSFSHTTACSFCSWKTKNIKLTGDLWEHFQGPCVVCWLPVCVTCSAWADSFSWRISLLVWSSCWSSMFLVSSWINLFFKSWSSSSTAAPAAVKEVSGLGCRRYRCWSQIKTDKMDFWLLLRLEQTRGGISFTPQTQFWDFLLLTHCYSFSSWSFQLSNLFVERSHPRFCLQLKFGESSLGVFFFILTQKTKQNYYLFESKKNFWRSKKENWGI